MLNLPASDRQPRGVCRAVKRCAIESPRFAEFHRANRFQFRHFAVNFGKLVMSWHRSLCRRHVLETYFCRSSFVSALTTIARARGVLVSTSSHRHAVKQAYKFESPVFVLETIDYAGFLNARKGCVGFSDVAQSWREWDKFSFVGRFAFSTN